MSLESNERMMDELQNTMRQAGINCLYNWRSWGVNEYHKRNEGFVLEVDYGSPHRVLTPEGSYVIGSFSYSGNAMKLFWKLMHEKFEITEIEPQRDDKLISEMEFQLSSSGPVLLIKEREE